MSTALKNFSNPIPTSPLSSLCWGLHEGFWSWADIFIGEYPDTWDLSFPKPNNIKEAQFLCDQCDHEIFKGCFSDAFGDKLLPGMYCMPIFAIPKPHLAGLWMVTHQTAGKYSLNDMIPCDNIVSYPLDNLCHLGEFLLLMHHHTPDSPHILFKSDISGAYCLYPMDPYWQIKQVNCIDRQFHVNRNCAFSGQASGCNWILFMSLLSWITKKRGGLDLLTTYTDDSFGPDHAHNVTWYQPYWKVMPSNQVKILQLWDEIDLPHKEKKQVSGLILTVIGIEVDMNALTMSMPKESLHDLLAAITDFMNRHCKYTLKEWQRLAGWINWSLNVFLLLCPSLNNFMPRLVARMHPTDMWGLITQCKLI